MCPAKSLLTSSDPSPAEGGNRSAPATTDGKSSRGNLLLVDDDPLASFMLGTWLRAKGYEATLATSPAEADKLLARSTFDLVLSDVYMPGNFRLEWVERVLKNASAPPVLLITGTPDLETACRAANLPVAGYLKKPINYILLEDAMTQVLAENRHRREFVVVTQAIIASLSGRPENSAPAESALIDRLTQLSAGCRTRTGRVAVDQSTEDAWRAAVAETIAVLEKTRHNFRSTELGTLRKRLQKLLA